MSDPIGLIGVGAMGRALLPRLRALGGNVQAYDVSDVALRAASEAGATVVTSPSAAARGASHVHVIVGSDDEVSHVTMGHEGVLAGASPGAVVFLHSTILPMTTRRIAEAAAKINVDVIDAPIAGLPQQLESGQGVFLIGGSESVVDTARAYLLQLGETVHYFGPLGSGNVAKLAKSMINAGERIVLAEVLHLAEAGGLDLRQFLEVERATGMGSPVSRWERIFDINNGHAEHRPAPNLFNKDVTLAAQLAGTYGLDAPLIQEAARTSVQWVREWEKLPRS
jgi:3-hydroxyisobutyrate dehydrogenase